MIQYQGYGDAKAFDTIEAFALARVKMDAPQIGGAICPALDYSWAVIIDGMVRNPTKEDERELRFEVSRLCRDCGDARSVGDAVVFGCGHVAHKDCHAPNGVVSCRFKNSEGASEIRTDEIAVSAD